MNREILIDCGIDYDDGVEKFMDEAELYEKLLVDFTGENTFDDARRYMESSNYEDAAKAVHAMKSVTGTLSMKGLYRLCSRTVELLRGGEYELAEESFRETYEGYLRITDGIDRAKDSDG